MGKLAELVRQKDPDNYKDWSDEDIEVAMLQKYPQSNKYKELADPNSRIRVGGAAAKKAQGTSEPPPLTNADVIPGMNPTGAPVIDAPLRGLASAVDYVRNSPVGNAIGAAHEAIEVPYQGLGMLADMIMTGGKNIRVGGPAEGITGAFTGGATLEKQLPQQLIDTAKRDVLGTVGFATGAPGSVLPGDEPHIKQAFAKEHPVVAGTEGIANKAAQLGIQMATDPAMLALGPMAQAGGAPLAGVVGPQALTVADKASRAAATGLGASFAGPMLAGSGEQAGEAVAAAEHGDIATAIEKAGSAAIDAAFAVHIAKGIRKSVPDLAESATGAISDFQAKRKAAAANKPVAADSDAKDEGVLATLGKEKFKTAGQVAGVSIGASAGSAIGHPLVGAIIGERLGSRLGKALDVKSEKARAERAAARKASAENKPDGAVGTPDPNMSTTGTKPAQPVEAPLAQFVKPEEAKKTEAPKASSTGMTPYYVEPSLRVPVPEGAKTGVEEAVAADKTKAETKAEPKIEGQRQPRQMEFEFDQEVAPKVEGDETGHEESVKPQEPKHEFNTQSVGVEADRTGSRKSVETGAKVEEKGTEPAKNAMEALFATQKEEVGGGLPVEVPRKEGGPVEEQMGKQQKLSEQAKEKQAKRETVPGYSEQKAARETSPEFQQRVEHPDLVKQFENPKQRRAIVHNQMEAEAKAKAKENPEASKTARGEAFTALDNLQHMAKGKEATREAPSLEGALRASLETARKAPSAPAEAKMEAAAAPEPPKVETKAPEAPQEPKPSERGPLVSRSVGSLLSEGRTKEAATLARHQSSASPDATVEGGRYHGLKVGDVGHDGKMVVDIEDGVPTVQAPKRTGGMLKRTMAEGLLQAQENTPPMREGANKVAPAVRETGRMMAEARKSTAETVPSEPQQHEMRFGEEPSEAPLERKIAGGISRIDQFPSVEEWWKHHKELGFSDHDLLDAIKENGGSDMLERKSPAIPKEPQPIVHVNPERQAVNLKKERQIFGEEKRGNVKPPEPPSNPATEVNGTKFGKVTFQEWLDRARQHLGEGSERWKESRHWYQQLNEQLKKWFPDMTDRDRGVMAFAVTQANASPSGGMLTLLRSIEQYTGSAKGKGGMPDILARIKAILKDSAKIDLTVGTGQKLSDFIDSALGRTQRSWTGEGGRFRPAAVDRHALTDVGYVYDAVKTRLGEQGGNLKVDATPVPSDAQYAYALKYYNDLTDWLNEHKVDGGGWTPDQAQAVGWTAVKIAQGEPTGSVKDMLRENTRRVLAEVTGFAGDSPIGKSVANALQGQDMSPELSTKITKSLGKPLVEKLAKATGVKVYYYAEGQGGYVGGVNANIAGLRLFGSPEAITDFTNALGKVAGQTEVISMRLKEKGGEPGVSITTDAKMPQPNQDIANIWRRAAEIEQEHTEKNLFGEAEGDTVMDKLGYTRIINKDGTSSLIVLRGKYLDPKLWKMAQDRVSSLINTAIKEAHPDSSVSATAGEYETNSAYNDWSAAPKGEQYDAALKGRRKGLDKDLKEIGGWFEKSVLDMIKEEHGDSGALQRLVPTEEVTLNSRNGDIKAQGYDSGVPEIAITKTMGKNNRLTLTHKPTGYALITDIPNTEGNQARLRDFALKVAEISGEKLSGQMKDLSKQQASELGAAAHAFRNQFTSQKQAFSRLNQIRESISEQTKNAINEFNNEAEQVGKIKTGEESRAEARKDPVGYVIDNTVNFLFDNMNRVAEKTGVGSHFGPRTPALEAYQGKYVNRPLSQGGMAGGRKPVWKGGPHDIGQLYVARTANIREAAQKLAGMDYKKMRTILREAKNGDAKILGELSDKYKEVLQETIAHEMLHSFRDTHDSTDMMQRAMNLSANQLLDTPTENGKSLRQELEQYWETKSVQDGFKKEVKSQAEDALNAYESNTSGSTNIPLKRVSPEALAKSEGPRPLQASLGGMLQHASETKHTVSKPVKGVIYQKSKFTQPRLAPKAPLAGMIKR